MIGVQLYNLASSADTISTQLATAVGGVQTDFDGYVKIVLPVALAIMGTIFGIRKAVKFFKSIA